MSEWIPPDSFKHIRAVWWDVIFDGNLYEVTRDMFPFPVKTDWEFRNAARYRAAQAGLRLSTRANLDQKKGWIVHVQVLPQGVPLSTRTPRKQAIPAPPVPMNEVHVDPRPRVDFSDTIARLLEQQVGEPVSSRRLIEHPVIGWFASSCTCLTDNFRNHPRECPAYLMLGMLEHDLKKCLVNMPEQWIEGYEKRFGNREHDRRNM